MKTRFLILGATFGVGLIGYLCVRLAATATRSGPRHATLVLDPAAAGEGERASGERDRPTEVAEEPDVDGEPAAAESIETPTVDGRATASAPPVEAPPPPGAGLIQGRVIDDRGAPVRYATVTLVVARRPSDAESGRTDEEEEIEYETLVETRSNGSGVYRLDVPRGGELCVRAIGRGYEEGKLFRSFPEPPYEERVDLLLRSRRVARVRGRLVDLDGKPLAPMSLLFLFPEAKRPAGAHRVRDFWGASGIFASSEPYCPGAWRAGTVAEQASFEPDSGVFEVEVPSGSERILTVVVRDRAIAERTWKEGDGEVEFRIDVNGLSRSLGTLELDVLDAKTLAPVPGADVSLRSLVGDFGMRSLHTGASQPSLIARGLPTGPYAAEVTAGGYAPGAVRVDVNRHDSVRAVVELGAPARIRLNLVPVDGWLPARTPSSLQYRTTAGLVLPVSGAFSETGEVLDVADAPTGAGFVVVGGNALRIDLAAGENPERGFPIRRPRRLRVGFRPDPGQVGPGNTLTCEARLIGAGGIPVVEAVKRVVRKKDGRCSFFLDAPPGSYAVEVQTCGGPVQRANVRIGEAGSPQVALDPM